MRRGVVLGGVLALVVVLPAAARLHDETVSLSAGETKRLKTIFNPIVKYRVTVSGVVTLTVSDIPLTIDPLFSYSGNCQNPSSRTGVRLIDSRGIDVFSPFSTVPRPKCRSDHTYTFTLNGPTPRTGVLNGRITAKNDITVSTARGDTASGAFTLEIETGKRDATFTVRAKKEVAASARDELLADVLLSGSGRIMDIDGDRRARGLLRLTVVWLTRDDAQLKLQPTGTWRYRKATNVGGSVRVVKSSVPACRGREMAVTLGTTKKGSTYVRMADPTRCTGLPLIAWVEPESEIDLTVKEVPSGK